MTDFRKDTSFPYLKIARETGAPVPQGTPYCRYS